MPEAKIISKPSKVIPKTVDWKQQKRSLIINHEVSKFTKAFRENFITLIISALGLVSALSWNDAIKSAINTLFPTASDLIYKFYVAVVVTIISVVITYFLSRVKSK
jgi:cytoskeletal protein RodZ